MAKLVGYDVSGVEESQGGTGVKVPVGVRVAKIAICEQRDKKSNGDPANDIRVGLNFGPEYDWGFTYVSLSEAADWKLAEFVRALQLPEKGKFDPAKQIGKIIRVKVNHGEYEGEYSPDIGRLMKPQPGDEEAWAEGNGSASVLSSKEGPDDEETPDTPAAASGEPDTAYREGEPSPDDPDEIVGSYDDWDDTDLEAEVGDRNLTVAGGRGSKRVKLIAVLRADDSEWRDGGGAAEEGADEEPAPSGDGDDYDDWDLDRLKQEWEERQMGDLPAIRGRGAADRMKEAIIVELRKDDEENPFEA